MALHPGGTEQDRQRGWNRSRPDCDDDEDDTDLSPEAQHYVLEQLQSEPSLSSHQRRIIARAKHIAIITKDVLEPGPGRETTDEHYRDTTGFLPDDSQSSETTGNSSH
jgi:hypothetical protein